MDKYRLQTAVVILNLMGELLFPQSLLWSATFGSCPAETLLSRRGLWRIYELDRDYMLDYRGMLGL